MIEKKDLDIGIDIGNRIYNEFYVSGNIEFVPNKRVKFVGELAFIIVSASLTNQLN